MPGGGPTETRRRWVPASTPSASSRAPAGATCAWAATVVALVAAPLAALAAAPDNLGPDGHTLLWLLGPMTIALLALWGLYASRTQPRMLDAVGKIIAATSLADDRR